MPVAIKNTEGFLPSVVFRLSVTCGGVTHTVPNLSPPGRLDHTVLEQPSRHAQDVETEFRILFETLAKIALPRCLVASIPAEKVKREKRITQHKEN
jgi:hypothetical protein